jgi:hypothetical protein
MSTPGQPWLPGYQNGTACVQQTLKIAQDSPLKSLEMSACFRKANSRSKLTFTERSPSAQLCGQIYLIWIDREAAVSLRPNNYPVA